MPKKTKQLLIRLSWGTVKTVLISFLIFLASTVIRTTVFYHDVPAGARDFTPTYCFMQILYSLAFYFGYLQAYSEDRKIQPQKNFDWKKELAKFIYSDGKYLIILYAVLAIVNEIALMKNWISITPALGLLFPLTQITPLQPIIILRSVIAYIATIAVMLLTALLKHYIDNKYWTDK